MQGHASGFPPWGPLRHRGGVKRLWIEASARYDCRIGRPKKRSLRAPTHCHCSVRTVARAGRRLPTRRGCQGATSSGGGGSEALLTAGAGHCQSIGCQGVCPGSVACCWRPRALRARRGQHSAGARARQRAGSNRCCCYYCTAAAKILEPNSSTAKPAKQHISRAASQLAQPKVARPSMLNGSAGASTAGSAASRPKGVGTLAYSREPDSSPSASEPGERGLTVPSRMRTRSCRCLLLPLLLARACCQPGPAGTGSP